MFRPPPRWVASHGVFMFKLAFSTVACPDRTLVEAFQFAVDCGYDGLELRTLGSNDPTLLCEPSLTGA
ncbi:MAG: hypothetical protein KDB18_08735, partial [Salinibacterium sp.]|nr:hypothetical protein [Salinibacterium sp.]